MRLLQVSPLLLSTVLAGRLLRRDQTITQNTRDASLAGSLGFPFTTTFIDAGVTYLVSGQGPHAIFGNLDNSGSLTYSQTDALSLLGVVGPLVVDYASAVGSNNVGVQDGNLVNRAGAFISINDFGATTGSTYNFQLNTLDNSGTMQLCGRGDNTGSPYTLTTIQNLNNNANAVISLEQYYGNVVTGQTVLANVGATGTSLSFNINNNGLIRLINRQLPLTQNILGTGCFGIGTGSVLYLTAGVFTVGTTSAANALAGQSIYFSATDSGSLRFDLVAASPLSSSNPVAPLIYGFGAGRFIEFIGFPILSFSYSGSTLTVNFGPGFVVTNRLSLDVGPGYTAGGFYSTSSNLLPAIGYSGTAGTRTIPAACQLAAPTCADPAVTVTAAFAVVRTATAASTSTTSAIDPVTTDPPVVTPTTSDVITTPTTTTAPIEPTDVTTATSDAVTAPTITTSAVNTGAYPSTVTNAPGTSAVLSTLAGGGFCTCPAPSITVYVTA